MAGSTTILGPDVTVEAHVLRFAGDVHVYGELRGDINTEGTLVVAEGGSVDGDVEADVVQVAGRLHGDLTCRKFDLREAASVKGVIRAERWTMEPGAQVDAEFVHADRARLSQAVPELEADYRAALAASNAAGGGRIEPSARYVAWAARLKTANKNRGGG